MGRMDWQVLAGQLLLRTFRGDLHGKPQQGGAPRPAARASGAWRARARRAGGACAPRRWTGSARATARRRCPPAPGQTTPPLGRCRCCCRCRCRCCWGRCCLRSMPLCPHIPSLSLSQGSIYHAWPAAWLGHSCKRGRQHGIGHCSQLACVPVKMHMHYRLGCTRTCSSASPHPSHHQQWVQGPRAAGRGRPWA